MLVQVTHMFSFHSLWQHQKTIYFLFSRNVISTSSVLSNLSGLTKFYSPWNHQETFGFLMISGRLKVYKCAQIWSEFRQPFLNYFYNIFRVFFLSFLELFFVIYTTYNQWSFNISPFSHNLKLKDVSLHVYMRPEVNSKRFEISNCFEMSFRLHGNLHGDFTAATFQTIARLYCTYANDIF